MQIKMRSGETTSAWSPYGQQRFQQSSREAKQEFLTMSQICAFLQTDVKWTHPWFNLRAIGYVNVHNLHRLPRGGIQFVYLTTATK